MWAKPRMEKEENYKTITEEDLSIPRGHTLSDMPMRWASSFQDNTRPEMQQENVSITHGHMTAWKPWPCPHSPQGFPRVATFLLRKYAKTFPIIIQETITTTRKIAGLPNLIYRGRWKSLNGSRTYTNKQKDHGNGVCIIKHAACTTNNTREVQKHTPKFQAAEFHMDNMIRAILVVELSSTTSPGSRLGEPKSFAWFQHHGDGILTALLDQGSMHSKSISTSALLDHQRL